MRVETSGVAHLPWNLPVGYHFPHMSDGTIYGSNRRGRLAPAGGAVSLLHSLISWHNACAPHSSIAQLTIGLCNHAIALEFLRYFCAVDVNGIELLLAAKF